MGDLEQTYTDTEKVIRFFAEGVPAAFSRDIAVRAAFSAKKGRKGRYSAIPPKIKEWRDTIQLLYLAAAMEADPGYVLYPRSGEYIGPVELEIIIFGSKADGSNILKEIEDALNGVAYPDDRVIVRGGFTFGDRMLSERGTILSNVTNRGHGVDISVRFR